MFSHQNYIQDTMWLLAKKRRRYHEVTCQWLRAQPTSICYMMPKRTTWFQCTKKAHSRLPIQREQQSMHHQTSLWNLYGALHTSCCNWTYELLICEGIIGLLSLPRLNPVRSYKCETKLGILNQFLMVGRLYCLLIPASPPQQ